MIIELQNTVDALEKTVQVRGGTAAEHASQGKELEALTKSQGAALLWLEGGVQKLLAELHIFEYDVLKERYATARAEYRPQLGNQLRELARRIDRADELNSFFDQHS